MSLTYETLFILEPNPIINSATSDSLSRSDSTAVWEDDEHGANPSSKPRSVHLKESPSIIMPSVAQDVPLGSSFECKIHDQVRYLESFEPNPSLSTSLRGKKTTKLMYFVSSHHLACHDRDRKICFEIIWRR